jgi:hypothetical protein
VLGFIWSRSPGEFDVRENALEKAQERAEKTGAGLCDHRHRHPHRRNPAGQTGRLSQQRHHAAGGLPGQYPQLGIRGADRIARSGPRLRNDFSRSQTQSVEDKDLQAAEPKFNYDSNHWIFPSTESEYRDGIERFIVIWTGSLTRKPTTGSSSPAPTT